MHATARPALLALFVSATACSDSSKQEGITTDANASDVRETDTNIATDTAIGACVGAKHTAGGPDERGGCWPGPNNTGVPAGTSLTPYDGPCTITTAGTVIDAKSIECDLLIKAANVKITRSRIKGSVATDEDSTGYSFEIADSQVDIGDRAGTGIGAVNFRATRVHVTGGNRSIHCWHDCTIEDSYVHGQFTDPSGTFHESGIRMASPR